MTPKFRAWDTRENKWWEELNEDDLVLSLSLGGNLYLQTGDDGGKNGLWEHDVSFAPGRFILEMSTGLKDVEGTEVFEGDILRLTVRDEDSAAGRTFEQVFEVAWDERDCSFVLSDGKYHGLSDHLGRYFLHYLNGLVDEQKIIGNVHQHPELLREEGKP